MHVSLLAVLLFIAATSADYGDPGGYHELTGIPLATSIKARDDRIYAKLYSKGEPPGSRGGQNGVFGQNNGKTEKGEKFFGISTPDTRPYFGGLIIHILNNPKTSVCGSSLITSKRLVTAAHCWDDGHVRTEQVTVVLGSDFLYFGGHRVNSSQVITHPSYNHDTFDHDIAIIYLHSQVNFSGSIFPIALPEGAELRVDISSHDAVGFGFGGTENPFDDYYNTDSSSVRKVPVQIISNEKCSEQTWYPASTDQLCSSGEEGKRPCLGNSGGPIITYSNRKFLIGISSFMGVPGPICAGGKPNIYTRVAKYMNFISLHAKLPKFKFHFNVLDESHTLENITVILTEIE